MDTDRKIVFISTPGPGRHAGFRRAVGLARAAGAPLTVLAAPGTDLPTPAEAAGLPLTTRHLPFGPLRETVRDALPETAALVVKMVDSRLGARGEETSQVDRLILRSVPYPVLLLPPKTPERGRVVLAAVALANHAPDTTDRAVVRMAANLAYWEDAELHVVHAWSLVGESILGSRVRGLGPDGLRRMLASESRERRRRLDALLTEEAPHVVSRVLKKGPATRVLRAAARRTLADTLVLGYHNRTGLWGFMRGNLAHGFLDTPALAVLCVPGEAAVLACQPSLATSRAS